MTNLTIRVARLLLPAIAACLLAFAQSAVAQSQALEDTGRAYHIEVGPGGGVTPPGISAVPVVAAAAKSLIAKASAGRLFSAYATSFAGGATGFLMIFDLATEPADGALAAPPLVCVPIAAGRVSVNYAGLPPAKFATAIIVVVSSGANCATKATGVMTAYISALVS